VSGIPQLTERGIYFLASRCRGLQHLRTEGDVLVSKRGLAALAGGLGRGVSRVADSFFGIEPAGLGPVVKLRRQWEILEECSAIRIQGAVRAWIARGLVRRLRQQKVLRSLSAVAAAEGARRIAAQLELLSAADRARLHASLTLQMGVKRWMRRRMAEREQRARAAEAAAAEHLDTLKARLRGWRVRTALAAYVWETISLQRSCRAAEARAVSSLGLQSAVRC